MNNTQCRRYGHNASLCLLKIITPSRLIGLCWQWPIFCAALCALAHGVSANTVHVTVLDDSGDGSIRQAIAATVSGGAVVIDVTGTIVLTNGELVIGRDLTLVGPGARLLALDGHNACRVFNVLPGVTANISGLTVTNGLAMGVAPTYENPGNEGMGGGILNNGALSMKDCLIISNSATGGSTADGSLGDPTSGRGGGIYNGGTMRLSRCTICLNSANGGSGYSIVSSGDATGGGIWTPGFCTLTNCTIAGNHCLSGTGNYAGKALGGGLASPDNAAGASVVSCTFSANSVVCAKSREHSWSSAAYGGGIQATHNFELYNSIVAGNAATAAPAAPYYFAGVSGGWDVYGAVTNSGYNLIGATNGSTGWASSDLVGNTNAPLDALLNALQYNDGPTPTMSLQAGSAAIDNGQSCGTGTDQRGLQRPVDLAGYADAPSGDGSDIGAFELSATGSAPSITTQPASQLANLDGAASFTVVAAGAIPLYYQWLFNGAPIPGATNASFIQPGLAAGKEGSYSVVVSNSADAVTSAVATLALIVPPVSQCVLAGSTASFTVSLVGGTAAGYQWYSNDVSHPITGANGPTLTLSNVQGPNNASYLVKLYSGSTFGYSTPATLSVGYSLSNAVVGGGRIFADPARDCYLPVNSTVHLYAVPADGWVFAGWSGAATGTDNPLCLTMDMSKSISATFTSTVPDIIVDNPAASFTGSWPTGTGASCYGSNYRYTPADAGGETALYDFQIANHKSGKYGLSSWFPKNSANTGHALYLFNFTSGRLTLTRSYTLDQAGPFGTAGGKWVSLEDPLPLGTGLFPSATLIVTNGYTQASHNLVADAFRLSWSAQNWVLPYLKSATSSGSNHCTLSWFAEPGALYRIQIKTNLTDAAWTDVTANLTAWDTIQGWTDSTGGGAQRFYRVSRVQ